MSGASFWLVIALVGLGTQSMRIAPILAHGRIRTPRALERQELGYGHESVSLVGERVEDPRQGLPGGSPSVVHHVHQHDRAGPDAIGDVTDHRTRVVLDGRYRVGLEVPGDRRAIGGPQVVGRGDEPLAAGRANGDLARVARFADEPVGRLDLPPDLPQGQRDEPRMRVGVVPDLVPRVHERLDR